MGKSTGWGLVILAAVLLLIGAGIWAAVALGSARPMDVYYIVVQVVGLSLAFVLGLGPVHPTSTIRWAVILGIVTNLAVQLPEGGPGLCIGMAVLPFIFGITATIGRSIRMFLVSRQIWHDPVDVNAPIYLTPGTEPRCRHCGYLLVGLPNCICPECGHAFEIRGRQKFLPETETLDDEDDD